ncbi:hypothetical protein [Photobacterium phage PDCC-1]|uniref:Uncharacterized protein n=1 Tax=Photobacterium phage PDCC-1 TaxID=2664246 RepID=A0A6B9J200_9CAUD|nr:hypothetical protein HWC77_gp176 [Photobacterium phage PDCC-1]QGZ14539.1 hypothetical protein [Photobacterium phage PDCC-1]
MSKQIKELMYQLVDSFSIIANLKHHKAVQYLNSGHCYAVATLAQHILKEKYDITVNLKSHPHHSFFEYDGVYYDTLFPVGYPLHPSEVWRMEEARCRKTLDDWAFGECMMVNPDPTIIAWVEYVTERLGISQPKFYWEMIETFEDRSTYDKKATRKVYHHKLGKYRRKVKRYRLRAWKFRNVEWKTFMIGWMAEFTPYPEDLWVDLEVIEYDKWVKKVISTVYPPYEEVMEKCFGDDVFDSPNVQAMGRLSDICTGGEVGFKRDNLWGVCASTGLELSASMEVKSPVGPLEVSEEVDKILEDAAQHLNEKHQQSSFPRGCSANVKMYDDACYQHYMNARSEAPGLLNLTCHHWKVIDEACKRIKDGEVFDPKRVLTLGSPDKLEDDPKRVLFAVEDNEGKVSYTSDREAWLNRDSGDCEE